MRTAEVWKAAKQRRRQPTTTTNVERCQLGPNKQPNLLNVKQFDSEKNTDVNKMQSVEKLDSRHFISVSMLAFDEVHVTSRRTATIEMRAWEDSNEMAFSFFRSEHKTRAKETSCLSSIRFSSKSFEFQFYSNCEWPLGDSHAKAKHQTSHTHTMCERIMTQSSGRKVDQSIYYVLFSNALVFYTWCRNQLIKYNYKILNDGMTEQMFSGNLLRSRCSYIPQYVSHAPRTVRKSSSFRCSCIYELRLGWLETTRVGITEK